MRLEVQLREVSPPAGGIDRLRERIERRRQVTGGLAAMAVVIAVALVLLDVPGRPPILPETIRKVPIARVVAPTAIGPPKLEGAMANEAAPVSRGALAIGPDPSGVRVYWVMDLREPPSG